MGPNRTQALIFGLMMLGQPVAAQSPGWQYSTMDGEGDRASMGCARGSTPAEFSCLVVRCEDDFSVGIHVHSNRKENAGSWEMTVDRENRQLAAIADAGPYGARLVDEEGWLLDRLRHGTFVYLRAAAELDAPFAYIDLSGSWRAIHDALYWCAPRLNQSEQSAAPSVDASDHSGEE